MRVYDARSDLVHGDRLRQPGSPGGDCQAVPFFRDQQTRSAEAVLLRSLEVVRDRQPKEMLHTTWARAKVIIKK